MEIKPKASYLSVVTEQLQVLPGPRTEDLDLVQVLAALADPVRLKLARIFYERGQMICTRASELADLSITKSTLSHHARTMRESGLVEVRVDGRYRWIRLRREDLDRRFPGLLRAVFEAPVPVAATAGRPD